MTLECFCKQIHMPQQDADYLLSLYQALVKRPDFDAYLTAIRQAAFALDEACGNAHIKKAADAFSLSVHTTEALFLLLIGMDAKQHYEAYRIPQEIYLDAMADIVTWMRMCKKETDEIGTLDNFGWLIQPMLPRILKIGRLQFEIIALQNEPVIGEKCHHTWLTPQKLLTKEYGGIPALNVHIPEGEPLSHDAVIASYQKATHLFADLFDYHPQYLICHSWLLAPQLTDILPAESNILKFASDYTMLCTDAHSDAKWRIFGSKLPLEEKTSLQKAAKAWYDAGNEIGAAQGIIKL